MIKHVIWDWNGTLVDDVGLCVSILNKCLLDHRKERVSVNEYRNKFFFPVSKFYSTLGLPSNGPMYAELASKYIQEYRNRFTECKLHANGLNVVTELTKSKISQSILSAGSQDDIENFTSYYGIDAWMSSVDGANNVEARGKEDRALAHFNKLGMNADQIILVGDTLHDWEVGKLIGCKVVLLKVGHVSEKRLREVPVPVIGSLDEIVSLLRD